MAPHPHISHSPLRADNNTAIMSYTSVDFEVHGRVQGVCFRMYTEDEARKLGVVGWVRNTRQGTVDGQVQGPTDKVQRMKQWLQREGSPSSIIDYATFRNEKTISKPTQKGFFTRY
ncbi:ACYP2 [Branchiostoma lanceolatum]|uniref:Acylphosphatase n=1 Tax=Branchiostoma lanceolatum TaxID=7740 RepID=A0A8J9VC62_BRALA|nr:ACYP2 [Branchiostoma lanceolatum]